MSVHNGRPLVPGVVAGAIWLCEDCVHDDCPCWGLSPCACPCQLAAAAAPPGELVDELPAPRPGCPRCGGPVVLDVGADEDQVLAPVLADLACTVCSWSGPMASPSLVRGYGRRTRPASSGTGTGHRPPRTALRRNEKEPP